ncbi:thiamine-binding protein [Gordonia aurantiaca]|uniref:thiamine-binding protein n=1 Tax=Gordonia sp. B21 TaxID=3151852 RepID=UPI0032640F31
MIVAFSLSPSGGDAVDADGGMSEAVAAAVEVVRASGLPNQTTAMFTYLEGEWDEVMAVVKAATEAVAARAPRVGLVLKADIRPGHTGELTGKVERVERHLESGS